MASDVDIETEGVQHDGLQCEVLRVEYDFTRRRGVLYVPEGNYCDMTGCIDLFTKIDPEIRRIVTVVGGEDDTSYQRKGVDWIAGVPLLAFRDGQ